MTQLAAFSGAWLLGLGALLAGLGSLLSGIASLKATERRAREEGRQEVLQDLSDWGGGG